MIVGRSNTLNATYNTVLADVRQLDVLEDNVPDHAVGCSRHRLDADPILTILNSGIIEEYVLDGCIT